MKKKTKKHVAGKTDSGSGSSGHFLKKQYLKTRPICKVTFLLPSAMAGDGAVVALAGEFNGWDTTGLDRMKRLKNGDHTLTRELETGREYRFRYVIDGVKWENDRAADRYTPNPYGGDDSVVAV